ncbi:factor 11 [Coemansia sp. RSA 2336]|nr:factor 11 [Coemansia sp. RSA 2336]
MSSSLDALAVAVSKASSEENTHISTVAPQIPESLVVVAKIRRGRPKRSEQGPYSIAQQKALTEGYQQIVSQIASEASEDNGGRRRQFICTVPGCGKVFYQRAHLNIHIRSHTGYKPYSCRHPGCGKSFPQLGNLRTHERTHTGDRPFKCHVPNCHRAFSQRGNLTTHLKKVHKHL